MAASSCGPWGQVKCWGGREGGIGLSLGAPVLGLEMLAQSRVGLPAGRELQQAPQAAKAPCRREVHSTVAEKGGKLFVGTKWTLHGVFPIRETDEICCTGKTGRQAAWFPCLLQGCSWTSFNLLLCCYIL